MIDWALSGYLFIIQESYIYSSPGSSGVHPYPETSDWLTLECPWQAYIGANTMTSIPCRLFTERPSLWCLLPQLSQVDVIPRSWSTGGRASALLLPTVPRAGPFRDKLPLMKRGGPSSRSEQPPACIVSLVLHTTIIVSFSLLVNDNDLPSYSSFVWYYPPSSHISHSTLVSFLNQAPGWDCS